MDLQGKTVVVLGGWGLVGSAVCRRLLAHRPAKIVVTSLLESEAREGVEVLAAAAEDSGTELVAWWGNIFGRFDERTERRDSILSDQERRRRLVDDVLGDLTEERLQESALFRLIEEHRPDAMVDCINTATAIAYQNIYGSARDVLGVVDRGEDAREAVETLITSLEVPQLIRHVQVLAAALTRFGASMYVKVGTAGSGGMGLNIPYTHSEERPSRVLLGKTAVAGAHTLLLFLMGRTPGGPIIKEVKPTATIAWKEIDSGEIRRRGEPIELVDCPPEKAVHLGDSIRLVDESAAEKTGETLSAPYINTGENGIFSRGEFEAITSLGQMEMITPEEIAEAVVFEILGGNSGHDVVAALDSSVYGPTYRGGYLRQRAVERLAELEEESGVDSVAFEMLGPPRLSKLLFEAYILRQSHGSIDAVLNASVEELAAAAEKEVSQNADLRRRAISIGIPILMSDGSRMLRGESIKIPPFRGEGELSLDEEKKVKWAEQGWIDLRPANMEHWQKRFARIKAEINEEDQNDSSSRLDFPPDHWDDFQSLPIGKVAAWIFTVEDEGARMKA